MCHAVVNMIWNVYCVEYEPLVNMRMWIEIRMCSCGEYDDVKMMNGIPSGIWSCDYDAVGEYDEKNMRWWHFQDCVLVNISMRLSWHCDINKMKFKD